MRLIDADALLKQYKPIVFTAQTDIAEGMRTIIEDINNAPTIDAVPVVQCKDCKYFYSECCLKTGFCVDDDWFCADGERMEEENETD